MESNSAFKNVKIDNKNIEIIHNYWYYEKCINEDISFKNNKSYECNDNRDKDNKYFSKKSMSSEESNTSYGISYISNSPNINNGNNNNNINNNNNNGNNKITRSWTEETTKYIMLTYRFWQLHDKKTMPLHEFYENTSLSLYNDLRIRKTATQIRDKVNNTKSSYNAIAKQIINHKNIKTNSLTPEIIEFMHKFFGENSTNSIEEVNNEIQNIINEHNDKSRKNSKLIECIAKLRISDSSY